MSAFTNISHIHKSLEIWEEDKIFSPVFLQHHTEPAHLNKEFHSGVSHQRTDAPAQGIALGVRRSQDLQIVLDLQRPREFKPSSWKPEHPYFCKVSHF